MHDKKTKICLVNPPSNIIKNNKNIWVPDERAIPHLGLGYIASVLMNNHFKVSLIECPMHNISVEGIIDYFQKNEYDMVGFSSYYYNLVSLIRIIEVFRTYFPKTFVFLGGYMPTLCTDDVFKVFKNKIDCCVIGEGEYTTVELANALENGHDWKEVKNIAYLSKGNIKINEINSHLENIDLLPFPHRENFENQLYVGMSTVRGCYGKCSYCGIHEFYNIGCIKKIRYRSVQNVIDEIKYIQNVYDPKIIIISDENFLVGSVKRMEWIEEFCNMLEAYDIRIKFQIQSRADHIIMNQEILKKLKNVGLNSIFIGVESFVQRQLDYYKKNISVKQNCKAIDVLREIDIKATFGLMLYDPYTSIYEILENITVLKRLQIWSVALPEIQSPFSLSSAVIISNGTQIYKDLAAKGKIKRNEIGYEFEDKKTAIFYKLLHIWHEIIIPLDVNSYYIIIAENLKQWDLSEKLKQLKKELYIIDLIFMEKFARYIEEGNEELMHNLLNENSKKIDKISTNMEKIIDYLKNNEHK